MPFKLKLLKKRQRYNVQLASASCLPRGVVGSQPNLHQPNSHQSNSHQSNLHHPRSLFLPQLQNQNQDPIYANAHAASLSLVEALHDTHVTTVQLQRPSLYQTSLTESQEGSLEERLKYLPPYRDPPDYETYMKKKYSLHGSLPFLTVNEDVRCHFSSMQHHQFGPQHGLNGRSMYYNHHQTPQPFTNGNYISRIYPTHSQSQQVLPQSRDFEMHNGSLPYLPITHGSSYTRK